MTEYKLTPWSLRPLWTLLLSAVLLFVFGMPVVMTLRQIVQGSDWSATGLLMALVVLSGLGAGLCLLMWSRRWRDVRWSVNFWTFISGPAPEYDIARQAWRWGRGFRLFMILQWVFAIPMVVIKLWGR